MNAAGSKNCRFEAKVSEKTISIFSALFLSGKRQDFSLGFPLCFPQGLRRNLSQVFGAVFRSVSRPAQAPFFDLFSALFPARISGQDSAGFASLFTAPFYPPPASEKHRRFFGLDHRLNSCPIARRFSTAIFDENAGAKPPAFSFQNSPSRILGFSKIEAAYPPGVSVNTPRMKNERRSLPSVVRTTVSYCPAMLPSQ